MIEIGVGTSEYVTYILTIMNTQGVELWSGFIDAKEITNPDGQLALVSESRFPNDLVEILKTLTAYHSEWKPAWEDITHKPSRLVESESVVSDE